MQKNHLLHGNNGTKIVKFDELGGVISVEVIKDGILQDSNRMIISPVELQTDLGEDIVRHIVRGIALSHHV